MEGFDRNAYETPQWLFDHYHRHFDFQWDLACSVDNAKCVNGLVEGSLEADWHALAPDKWLWMNPPYKPLKPWVEKAQKESALGAKIVALVPLPSIACLYFWSRGVYRIDVIQGRISFERHGIPHHGNDSTHCLLFWDRERCGFSTQLNFVDAKQTEMEWLLQ